jgi:hypothetical protein
MQIDFIRLLDHTMMFPLANGPGETSQIFARIQSVEIFAWAGVEAVFQAFIALNQIFVILIELA